MLLVVVRPVCQGCTRLPWKRLFRVLAFVLIFTLVQILESVEGSIVKLNLGGSTKTSKEGGPSTDLSVTTSEGQTLSHAEICATDHSRIEFLQFLWNTNPFEPRTCCMKVSDSPDPLAEGMKCMWVSHCEEYLGKESVADVIDANFQSKGVFIGLMGSYCRCPPGWAVMRSDSGCCPAEAAPVLSFDRPNLGERPGSVVGSVFGTGGGTGTSHSGIETDIASEGGGRQGGTSADAGAGGGSGEPPTDVDPSFLQVSGFGPDFADIVTSLPSPSLKCNAICLDEQVALPACGSAADRKDSNSSPNGVQKEPANEINGMSFDSAYEEDRTSNIVRGICAQQRGAPETSYGNMVPPRSVASRALRAKRWADGPNDAMQSLEALLDDAGARMVEKTEDVLLCQQNSAMVSQITKQQDRGCGLCAALVDQSASVVDRGLIEERVGQASS